LNNFNRLPDKEKSKMVIDEMTSITGDFQIAMAPDHGKQFFKQSLF
jgi:predicted metallopeptidase